MLEAVLNKSVPAVEFVPSDLVLIADRATPVIAVMSMRVD
jgi:hypothetical protein